MAKKFICVLTCTILLIVVRFQLVVAQEKGIGDFPKLNAQLDWPWWRGPQRNGHAIEADVPVKLDDSHNLLWATKVPGRGHASPIVVGSKVFLSTSFAETQTHSMLAFDLKTGEQLWSVDLNQGGFPEKNHSKNTEATSTIACDGELLFVTYYHHDGVHLSAVTIEGKPVWTTKVARFRPKIYEYGYAPSPLLYRDTVIVAYEYDGPSSIEALYRTTGKPVWKAERKQSISFSSPVIVSIAGKDQLILSGQGETAAYNPATGKSLWSTPGPAIATCGTAAWDGNTVFVSGGYPESQTLAIDAASGGKVVWRNREKCYEESMVTHNGYLYAFTGKGVMFCWRATDGKEMWKQRLSGPVSASPVLVGNRIYWANESGVLYVVKADPSKFELLAENHIGNSSFASPAVSGNRILVRVADQQPDSRQEYLYAFGPEP